MTRVLGGAPLRGPETVVELDEAGFPGPGDIFLFVDPSTLDATTLDDLFAAQLPLNTFHVLRVRLHPSNGEMTWPPRTGTGTLL